MKKMVVWLLCAALALSLAACGRQNGTVDADSEPGIISGVDTLPSAPEQSRQAQSASSGEDSSSSEDAGWEDVSAAEYKAYRDKYVVPYGSLKFYGKSWTNAADLGADLVFAFTLQKNFNFYDSALDYGFVFGDAFTPLQIPETWFDENYGIVYPQDIIENVAVEAFGVDKEFLRTAKAYIPAKNGYAAPPQNGAVSSATELMPEVTKVRRNGIRAEITFTLTPCDPNGKLLEGNVQKLVMVVEDKQETFRYVSVTAE